MAFVLFFGIAAAVVGVVAVAIVVAVVDVVVMVVIACLMSLWQTLQYLTISEMFKCCYICHGIKTTRKMICKS